VTLQKGKLRNVVLRLLGPCPVAFRGRGKDQGAETVQESSIDGNQGLLSCLRKYKLDQRLCQIKQVSACSAVYKCENNLC